jgi:rhamnosyltransferase
VRTLIYALRSPISASDNASQSQHLNRQLELLSSYYDHVVTVSDGDGEWAKWRAGIQQLGWDNVSNGSLTLMTDAAFGPTVGLPELLDRLEADSEKDYWTFSNVGSLFFFHFNPRVVRSSAFKAFWDAQPPSGADAVTLKLHLFRALATAAFADGVVVPVDPQAPTTGMSNPDAPRPDLWVEVGAPFLLIDDLLERPDFAPYALEYLNGGGYPAETASAHLSQLSAPDEPSLLWAKQHSYARGFPVPSGSADDGRPNKQKVAVHVHAHFPDMLPPFFQAFANYNFPFKLFITTAKTQVTAVNEQLSVYTFDAEVVPVPNVGRDIYPLILLNDKLSNYDVIGHFHTKKTGHDRGFVGTSWLRELMEMLVIPGDAIAVDFQRRPELGLVISDVPSFFRLNRSVKPEGEAPLIPMMNNLWARMGLEREFNFEDRATFVMSYGTFFWARYDAIKPLLELKGLEKDIPKEPIPAHHTILHAIERMLVYLAWAQGYDFAISEGKYMTVFADEPAPYLEAVPFKSLVRQKISNRIPPGVKRKIRPAKGN